MVLVMSITLGILTINVWDLPNMLPSGKRLHNYGKYPFFMGKSTISMAIFISYVTNYQRVSSSVCLNICIFTNCVS